MAPSSKRALPSKEATLFRELLTLYETRQLKKGVKTADQILKKFPEHGETLCMKGLCLAQSGKREEGIELVKKGMRFDLTSHICWHVFGLIQKDEKNYEEALKSYTQALRFDKENINILRDSAQLQTQLRIYDGLVETRHTLLRLRPSLRQHWIALAVAHHLNGNLSSAKKILEHYEYSLKNIPDYDVEHSETLLYHVRILEDLGEYAEGLSLLDINSKSRAIVDRTAIMEFRARLLSKLRDTDASNAWRALIDHNSDCYEYYRGYLAGKDVDLDNPSDESRAQALAILQEFASQLPKAATPRRMALSFATGEQFSDLIQQYLRSGLTKGVPSLFADIKGLYTEPQKYKAIQEAAEAILQENTPPEGQCSHGEPTTYLWTLCFLAQHYSYVPRATPSQPLPSPDFERALALLSTAIAHTPTLPELYTLRARVLKRAGDPLGAAAAMNEARLLDGQDRFLNTKCAKYHLRAGMIDEAIQFFGMFTKKDATNPGADLEEMQSTLYLIEAGDAEYRLGKLHLALKRYVAVDKIFHEMEDDQYDFHGYSLRKFNLNIYLNLLAWEDRLRSHPAYVTAALQASRIFVKVHDDPSLITAASSSVRLSDAEKKARKKAKKAASKAHDDKKPATASTADDTVENTPAKDDDPDGVKLLGAADGLDRAAKLLQPLESLAASNIDAWLVIYDVAVRRKKYLQAIKALKHAQSLDSEHAELHTRLVDFKKRASAFPQVPPAPIGPLVTTSLATLLPEEVSLETYNSLYLQRHSGYAPAVLAAARVSHSLGSAIDEVDATLFTTLADDAQLDIVTASKILDFLKAIKSSRVEEYRLTCVSRFPLSTVFMTQSELSQKQKQTAEGTTALVEAEKLEVVP
ncbi:hypothetical protein PLEOSDRAFT_1109515 [Pleurotus ostreatus PC15]|uniref:Uncharacterized protein n=1 Tax=Pleurotus ostreatus (strain PC15) TaxID=1137138 RepID=A0A067N628_PLEO1|nr:hypothetical protein PLEOSDRAFT_1109515 [Pleurotus ostreatus PC15]